MRFSSSQKVIVFLRELRCLQWSVMRSSAVVLLPYFENNSMELKKKIKKYLNDFHTRRINCVLKLGKRQLGGNVIKVKNYEQCGESEWEPS